MAGLQHKGRIKTARAVYRISPPRVIDCLTAARTGIPSRNGRMNGVTAHDRATGATESRR